MEAIALISPAEAARRINVSRQRMAVLLDSGRIPFVIIGSNGSGAIRRVNPIDLAEFAARAVRTVPQGHVTVRAAAALLDRDESNVRRWIASGRLPSIEHDGMTFVARSVIDTFQPPARGRPRTKVTA